MGPPTENVVLPDLMPVNSAIAAGLLFFTYVYVRPYIRIGLGSASRLVQSIQCLDTHRPHLLAQFYASSSETSAADRIVTAHRQSGAVVMQLCHFPPFVCLL